MKHVTFALFALFLVVGCHGQAPTQPILSCPDATTVGTYAALNAASPTAATTYNDTTPTSSENVCYIVQSLQTVNGQKGTSAPSNIAGPFTIPSTGSSHLVELSWTAPAGTGYTYLVSRVDAISTPVTPPVLGTSPTVSQIQLAAPDSEVAEVTNLKIIKGR